jgi:hypothetical protein
MRRSKSVATAGLFDDLERGALTVARGRTGQQRPNRLNGLAISTDNTANIALAKLHPEDGRFATRNLREHHFVRELDQMTNDKLKKFFHIREVIRSACIVMSTLLRKAS